MLHGIAGNKGAGPAEASLAVDGDGTLFVFGEGDELVDDIDGGDAAVGEVEFLVLDAILDEIVGVVGFVIEPDHSSDS